MFIGREKELSILDKKIDSSSFEFGIVYGRRRVGKTRLLQEVVKKHNALYYVCNEMGLEFNLKQLGNTVASFYNEPVTFDSLEMVFEYLVKKSLSSSLVLIIDEFTYLMSANPEVLSILQNIIDHKLLDTNIKLILSGSHVGMIESALSYSKPLYGRATFKLKVEAFDYYDAAKFYPNASNEDKVRLYSIFGGIPFYTSRINDKKSVKENILSLIVDDGAIFENETSFLLSQEVRSISSYGKILNAIASGATRLNEITTKSGMSNSGTTSNCLDTLLSLGIIEKEYCFGEGTNSKKTIYRIQDQLFNFHYTFIEKNKTQKAVMNHNSFYDLFISQHSDEFVSFEYEKICRDYLKRKYSESIEEIGRYWFNDSKKKLVIEIDIVMRNKGELFVHECKWTNAEINLKIKSELENKAQYLGDFEVGFFSKSGFTKDLDNKNNYGIDDLYSLLPKIV